MEARATAPSSTRLRTTPCPITKNDLAPNVNRSKAVTPAPESQLHEHSCLCQEEAGGLALQRGVLAEDMLKGPSPENLGSDD